MIVIDNIHKYFGGFKAVDGTSLEIKKNSITGLIGPNGAGKTTLLRTLAGDGDASQGEVWLNGKTLRDYSLKELARARSVMTQSTDIAFNFSVLEILEMSMKNTLLSLRGLKTFYTTIIYFLLNPAIM